MRPALVVLALAAIGCRSYLGTARDTSPATLTSEPGWSVIRGVPYVAQETESACGAAALGMVISYWTGAKPTAIAAHFQPVPTAGIAAGRLRDFARTQGLASFVIAGQLEDLSRELASGRPVLVGLVKRHRKRLLNHYEVVVGLHPERKLVVTLDPAEGWRQNTLEGFLAEWKAAGHVTLIVSARPADAGS